MGRLRPRQKLGKYRIVRRLGDGGFATVYHARDTIEGIPVALKVPHHEFVTKETLKDFQREVRIAARMDHPNILPIKNADFIEGHFVIAMALGERTLAARLKHRISLRQTFDYIEQLLEALSYAHDRKVIHCDVKPDNLILFEGDLLRLADFGIAKVKQRTMMSASGSGTLGFLAPEQAMGKPSFRSDCFAAGLLMYRMITGKLPKWPYEWPLPSHQVLRRKATPQLIDFLKKSLALSETQRFRDAGVMLAALQKIRSRALARDSRKRRRRSNDGPTWQSLRHRAFRRQYGRQLQAKYACSRCEGPVSEAMHHCPWCGASRKVHRTETTFPKRCTRCKRGMKLDWRFCPWCYGAAQGPDSDRNYSDVRYEGRCSSCRGDLMPFMHYCPWCRAKVRRPWKIEHVTTKCTGCKWPVLPDYWQQCPWCARSLRRKTGGR